MNNYIPNEVKDLTDSKQRVMRNVVNEIENKRRPKHKWRYVVITAVLAMSVMLFFLNEIFIDNEQQSAAELQLDLTKGKELAVDMSDIEQMNIGAEMPRLLYADNNIVVMEGAFGVVVYNMQDSIVTNRISYEQIEYSYDISRCWHLYRKMVQQSLLEI